MTEKKKGQEEGEKKISRRNVLKAAAVAGGAAATVGFPAVARLHAQTPIQWKVQTAWDAGTVGYNAFQKYCGRVKEAL